jgi:preprotein translocase subunit SecE
VAEKEKDKIEKTAKAELVKAKPVKAIQKTEEKTKTPAVVAPRTPEKKEKKPNFFQRYWRESIGELRKVSWPTRQDALRLTWIVLAVMGIMSALLGTFDWVFSKLVTLLVTL